MKRAVVHLLALALAVTACTPPNARRGPSYEPVAFMDRTVPLKVTRTSEEDAIGAEPPPPFARKRTKLSSPTEDRLKNGVRVLMLERHDFPAASVSFVIDRGDTAAADGVALMYSGAAQGASKDYTSYEAYQFLAYLGASTNAWVEQDGIGLEVSVLSPFLHKALAPVASMFAAPALDGDAIGHARRSVRVTLAEERDSPSLEARRALRRMLFGREHPRARGANPDAVDSVGRKELEEFREAYLVAERVTVVAVGDFDPEKLLARLEVLLKGLPTRKAIPAPALLPMAPPSAARVAIVPRRGATQSNVAIGFPSTALADEAHAALRVLQALLGRGLSGRLDLKIRREHGFSYGVRVADEAYRDAGTFVMTAAVETPHTAEAVKGILDELARFRTEPVDAAELARAKRVALEALVTENTRGDSLATLAVAGLPLGYHEQIASRIEALDAAALRAAAERFLVTEKVQIAVVGDEAVLRDPLRALGLGEVTVQPGR